MEKGINIVRILLSIVLSSTLPKKKIGKRKF